VAGSKRRRTVNGGLAVPEVWLFRDGAFEIYHLAEDGYAQVERSRFLPELDLPLIARLAQRDDQHSALRELQEALRDSE
jgi:hypothetical protein